MLEVGIGLSTVESQTHFAAWAVTSAPLAIGFDLTNNSLYDELYPIIANKQAVSINQQWAGNPGNLVANATEYREYLTEHGAGGRLSAGAAHGPLPGLADLAQAAADAGEGAGGPRDQPERGGAGRKRDVR